MLKSFQIILLTLLLSSFAYSQEKIKFHNKRFGWDLSRNSITVTMQDKYGFLWFGTKFGLLRFDGYDTRVFTYDHTDSLSIAGNFIRDLHEADDGKIWIAVDEAGVSYFEQENQKFTKLDLQEFFPELNNINRAWAVRQDKQNKNIFWFGTFDGLVKYNIVKHSAEIYRKDNSGLNDSYITKIFEDSRNILWVGTRLGGVNRFDKDTTFTQYQVGVKRQHDRSAFIVFDVHEDSENNIWCVSQTGGLMRINMRDNSLKTWNGKEYGGILKDSRLLNIDESDLFPGKIILCEWAGGIELFDPVTETVENISEDQNFRSNDIISFFEDRSGVLWFGTDAGGLEYIYPQSANFYSLELKRRDVPGKVTDINKIGNDFWIATTDGIFLLPDNNKHPLQFSEVFPDVKLSGHNIQGIQLAEDGRIVIGTFWNGINVFDPEKRTNIAFGNTELNYARVNNIKLIGDEYWVGTYRGGIFIYSTDYKLIKELSPKTGDLLAGFVSGLVTNNDGKIWIGSGLHGIAYIDIKTKEIEYCDDEGKINKNLSLPIVNDIYFDDGGKIFFATGGGGLNIYNTETSEMKVLKEKNGLTGDKVNTVIQDNAGNYWICTSNGLAKYNEKEERIYSFTEQDGLEHLYLSTALYDSATGVIILGSNKGITMFSPDSLERNTFIPPVYLTSATIPNGNITYGPEIMFVDELLLEHNQNIVSFEFAALNYIFPDKNLYQYKIEGIHPDWSYLGKDRKLTITNLSSGSYTLMLRGSNNDGIWNETATQINIIVKTPWWDTIWFRFLVVILVFGLVYFIYQIRQRRLKAIQRLRLKIASDLHDDIGASLTKISINAGMLKYESKAEKLKERVEKIENSSKEVISSMSDVIWSIDSRRDKLSELISRMRSAAFDIFSDTDIDFRFNQQIPAKDIDLPVDNRENLFLIYKEAINNIAKHSGAKNVEVNLNIIGKKLSLSVQDDGVGIKSDTGTSGNGLTNMNARAEKINGKLEIQNKNGTLLLFTTNNFFISHKQRI